MWPKGATAKEQPLRWLPPRPSLPHPDPPQLRPHRRLPLRSLTRSFTDGSATDATVMPATDSSVDKDASSVQAPAGSMPTGPRLSPSPETAGRSTGKPLRNAPSVAPAAGSSIPAGKKAASSSDTPPIAAEGSVGGSSLPKGKDTPPEPVINSPAIRPPTLWCMRMSIAKQEAPDRATNAVGG
jgi:hypothetical protein